MKLFIAVVLCAGILSSNAVPTDISTNSADKSEKMTMSDKLAIIEAVKTGNLKRYEELMKGRDVNKTGKHGNGAIHYLSETGDEKLVDFLLKKGADITKPDDEGNTAVHRAALNPNEKVMDLLIKHGGDVNKANNKGNRPVHLAGLNSNEKVMELLLNNGADITKLNDEEETALHWAVANRNEKVADLLIKKGIDLKLKNDDSDTALHIAALNSNPKVAELLIKAGADVNAVGSDGWTPIFFAVFNGNELIKKFITERDDDETYGKKKAAMVLLEHWQNPMEAHANEKLVELLVNNGANINQKDTDDEMTPYDQATLLGDERMKEFLIKHGATSKDGKKD